MPTRGPRPRPFAPAFDPAPPPARLGLQPAESRWTRDCSATTIRSVANQGSRTPPPLATWAEVDPARYPFDPSEVPAFTRRATPAPPFPQKRGDDSSEAWSWVETVGSVLSDRYGPWAYRWESSPDSCWILNCIPTPAEAPTFVAESLLNRRRWLETLAERFDRFLPLLDPARAVAGAEQGLTTVVSPAAGDIAATWEVALANLIRTAAARVDDHDGWQGWCCLTIQWFLTANGIPVRQAEALASSAFPAGFPDDDRLTQARAIDVAERLTREVLNTTERTPAAPAHVWPDTWPHHWPAWRATNTTGHGWR